MHGASGPRKARTADQPANRLARPRCPPPGHVLGSRGRLSRRSAGPSCTPLPSDLERRQARIRGVAYRARAAGGLLSYGPPLTGMFALAANYVDRIAKG